MDARRLYQRENLTGLAPLFLHGLPAEPRQLSFIGSGVTDYLGGLFKTPEAAAQIWQHLANSRHRWDLCDLQEIPPGSPLLVPDPPSGIHVETSVASVCPLLHLPASITDFESRLSPKFRHHLRNARNRLRDIASFEIAGPDRDPEYVEALFRLHAARWRARGEPGVLSTSPLQSFFREVIRQFRDRGWLKFYGLRYRARLAAVACVFSTRRRNFYYIGGFDLSLSRYSPGTVLIGQAIEHAIEAGSTEFDFLRNSEPYKYQWGATDRINTHLRIGKETSAVGR